jgi:asparagine synthetase B (glutamine-hydrolysing)
MVASAGSPLRSIVVRDDRIKRRINVLHSSSTGDFAVNNYLVMPREAVERILPGSNRVLDETRTEVESETEGRDPIESMLTIDQFYIMGENYNYKADKSSSACGLEERVPLQDHFLVDYMNSIALSGKLSFSTGKIPLRRILRTYIPELASRPKQGFGAPRARWLRKSLSTRLDEAISDKSLDRVVDKGFARAAQKRLFQRRASEMEVRFLWNLTIVFQGMKHFEYV